MTTKDAWYIYQSLQSCMEYMRAHIEAGAQGMEKDWRKAQNASKKALKEYHRQKIRTNKLK